MLRGRVSDSQRPNVRVRGSARIAYLAAASLAALVVIVVVARLAIKPSASEAINVSAASSLTEALTEIAGQYSVQTHDQVELTFGSSGQLGTQIRYGAPVDVFIAASSRDVDQLDHVGMIEPGTRRIVAGNELVLIVPADDKSGLTGFEQLRDSSISRIAIGEPKTVPAGQYAMQVLTALKLAEVLQPRLIYGSSVRQVLDYVERGEVSAGIVYATDARQGGQAGRKVRVVAIANPSTHERIVYPAAVLKNSLQKAAAAKFIEYLASESGQSVLEAHGFSSVTSAATATGK